MKTKSVKVRYNTLCEDDHTFWRVLIDGEEHNASNVIIEVPVRTTRDIVWDKSRNSEVDKHHISCNANEILWEGDIVIIK